MLAFMLAMMVLFCATQYIAYVFNYQASLGAPVYDGGSTPIYWPWASILWALRFGSTYPLPFERAFGVLALIIFMITMLAIGLRRRKHKVAAFGTDEWGNRRDAENAGLFAQSGVVTGLFESDLMIYDGPEHHLVSGASRSGKGVGHVIPTLQSWSQSAIVYDIKNELYDQTAGHRATFSDVIRFNPTDQNSLRFNPLLEVRKGVNEIRDVQNIVEILADPSGQKDDQNIWDGNAKQFLTALCLHVLYTAADDQKHLGTVRARLLYFNDTLDDMASTAHRLDAHGEPEVHPEIARVAMSMANKSERFKSSVQGTAEDYLTLYADPVVVSNTAVSDFNVGDLMCGTNPVTLYIQPPPSDEARVRPLIRLFINQICRSLMEHKERDGHGREKRHKLLLLIDEFPTLGKLDFFQVNMGQMAGYGMKAVLVVQSFNHIERAYGADNVIIDNCHVLVAFASADTRTQERISKMTGEAVEYRESYSTPRNKLFDPHTNHTVSESETMRRLMQPGDVREMGQDTQLVFVTGFPPFKTRKLRFFEHDGLNQLTQIPAPANGRGNLQTGARTDWHGERGQGAIEPEPIAEPEDDSEQPGSEESAEASEPDEPEAGDDELF